MSFKAERRILNKKKRCFLSNFVLLVPHVSRIFAIYKRTINVRNPQDFCGASKLVAVH
jgi:hypothetical protein